MNRVLPHPLMSLALWIMWLLLNGSLAPRTLLFGALLALLAPLTMRALTPAPARIRNPLAILKLTGVVLVDIIRSNIAVAGLILNPRRRDRVSGFIHIPLTLRDRYALAVLAIIITSTPGTLWVQYDSGRNRLLLHVLDLVDEADWEHLIQNRYARLLTEIFE
jgi:multicomponent K+:H+ antiporter subunit E